MFYSYVSLTSSISQVQVRHDIVSLPYITSGNATLYVGSNERLGMGWER